MPTTNPIVRPLAMASTLALLTASLSLVGCGPIDTGVMIGGTMGGATGTPAAAVHAPRAEPAPIDCETLAWRAKDTATFARFVNDMVARSGMQAEATSAMLARAAILAAHADAQSQRVAAAIATKADPMGVEVRDLQAREDGLTIERTLLERELAVWQVQHGLLKAEETDLIYTPNTPGGAGC